MARVAAEKSQHELERIGEMASSEFRKRRAENHHIRGVQDAKDKQEAKEPANRERTGVVPQFEVAARLSDPSDTKEAIQRLEARMMKQENELELLRNRTIMEDAAGAGKRHFDFERPHSLACYCIAVAMDPLEPTLDGILATTQVCLLTFCQYVLSHAFFDTSWLSSSQGLLARDIPMAEFYVAKGCPTCDTPNGFFDRSLRWNCDGPDGFAAAECVWLPKISIMASLVAMFLLVATAVMPDE